MLDLAGVIVQDAFWSALAGFGFAILFNVPRRALVGCAIAAAVGHATRTLLERGLALDLVLATLIGSIVIGFVGHLLARRHGTPALVVTVSASVVMVPGVFAYRTMIGLLQISTGAADPALALVEASTNAIRTAILLGAIGLGIALPTLIFDRRRPVV